MGNAYFPSFQLHPGIWVNREIIETYGLTVGACAEQLRMEAFALQALLDGREPLSTDTALRLQNVFGIKAATLLAMQSEFDAMQRRAEARWSKAGRALIWS